MTSFKQKFYTLALLHLPSLHLPSATWVSLSGAFLLAQWGGLSWINHRHPGVWHVLPISIYSICRMSQCHSHHTIDRVLKIHIKTLKTLLHIPIIRSSSGSILCSLLKLQFKTLIDLLRYINLVLWQHVVCYVWVVRCSVETGCRCACCAL